MARTLAAGHRARGEATRLLLRPLAAAGDSAAGGTLTYDHEIDLHGVHGAVRVSGAQRADRAGGTRGAGRTPDRDTDRTTSGISSGAPVAHARTWIARRGRLDAVRRAMLAAAACSAVLACEQRDVLRPTIDATAGERPALVRGPELADDGAPRSYTATLEIQVEHPFGGPENRPLAQRTVLQVTRAPDARRHDVERIRVVRMARNGIDVLRPPNGRGELVIDRTAGTVERYAEDGRLVGRAGAEGLAALHASLRSEPLPPEFGRPPTEVGTVPTSSTVRFVPGVERARERTALLVARFGPGAARPNGQMGFRRTQGDSVWEADVDAATGLPTAVDVTVGGRALGRLRYRYERAGGGLLVPAETSIETEMRGRDGRVGVARTRIAVHGVTVGDIDPEGRR